MANDPGAYVTRQLAAHPDWQDFVGMRRDWAAYDFAAAWRAEPSADTEAALMRMLRRFRHRHCCALVQGVVDGEVGQQAFVEALSDLAAVLVEAALEWHFQALAARYGYPRDEAGNIMRMTVLGMGKFGGRELNFSSDIDLIFVYAHGGDTDGDKSEAHEVFFRKLSQKLIRALDEVTEDGFCYRVDMRLRPFGKTGPLALTHEAMEQYYLLHGRDWERYALMKARPVAGDLAGGAVLLETLRPFMYRRYLDYAALESLSKMKESINREIRTEGMENHIKLGAGGIREAEFAVQAMQLIYGGQYPRLQSPSFLHVLACLGELGFWEKARVAAWREDYLLLRSVENALQFEDEKQTHILPDQEVGWERLAAACRFSDAHSLRCALQAARARVQQGFDSVFAGEDSVDVDEGMQVPDWRKAGYEELLDLLQTQGLAADVAAPLADEVRDFVARTPWQRLPDKTARRIEKLLPQLLTLIAAKPEYAGGFAGIAALVEAVARREVYIGMLAEQQTLLAHLLAIAASSRWLMAFICAHPLVLDEVLSERSVIDESARLAEDLAARLDGVEDDETWLTALRDFKHAQVFKVAWSDVHGRLPLMTVSDYLSWIATLVLERAYQRAYAQLALKYGEPRRADGSLATFAIIGFGKLGGLELGYGSDLDVVFLFDQGEEGGMTDGDKALDNTVFFTRLVQRLTNYLQAPSTSGVLYELDTRLRPGGQSGLMVSSVQAFAKYQQESAWTWEHQALSRARFIVGDSVLGARFERIRHEVLCAPRDDSLRHEVLAMRDKMQAHAAPAGEGQFHLKHGEGGLVDIEFMVQYLLLKHAHGENVIARMSDNIRQLAALEATGLMSSVDATALRDSYRRLRQEAHRCYLNDEDSIVPAAPWQGLRDTVRDIWRRVFAENT